MFAESVHALDVNIAQILHVFFARHPVGADGAIFLNYAGVAVLVALVAWHTYKKRNALQGVFFLFIIPVGYFISRLGKFLWERPRPFVQLGFEPLINTSAASLSFPSSHATVAFALAGALYHYDKKWGRWALGCAAIVAASRVLVGVHFVSDVLAGAVLGVVTSLVLIKLWKLKK